jgi:dehydrogenase/reductase SDR family protein 1
LPETVDAVERVGGRGIAVQCDHSDDDAVRRVVERVVAEAGRVDVLVNSVYPSPTVKSAGVPFWELPVGYWDALHGVGLRAHYVASSYVAPVMVRQGSGLIVNVSSPAAGAYSEMFGVPHGVAKAALDRMTADMARELAPHGVTVVSLWPGALKGEKLTANPPRLPQATIDFILKSGESPQLTGRAIAALAADPDVLRRSGRAYKVSDLAADYGFSDIPA